MRPLILPLALFALAGCSSLDSLKTKAPEANDFPSSLASEYLGYAQSESEQGFRSSAEHFAAKGLSALEGEMVAPEDVADTLPETDKTVLIPARAELMAVINEDTVSVVPQAAARAQVMYDCMVTMADPTRKPNDPSLCSEEFLASLGELQKVASTLAVGKGESRFITFETGSAALNDGAQATIKGISEYAAATPRYVIALEGRSTGPKSRSLFVKRVGAIRKAFAALGTNPKRIVVEGGASAKAVHLSRSETVTDPNAVRISVRILHHPGKKQ